MFSTTFHRDGSVTYWSVYLQLWQRVSTYSLTNRHDDYAALPEVEQKRISKMALSSN